jgi:single-strand DNA-binding protein
MFGQIVVIGRLTRDPEFKEFNGGSKNAKFTVAQNYGFGDNKDTLFVDTVVWGAQGEAAAKYAKKGTLVMVTGEPRKVEYTAKDGTKVKTFEVHAREWKKLSFEEAEAIGAGVGGGSQTAPISDDELPF